MQETGFAFLRRLCGEPSAELRVLQEDGMQGSCGRGLQTMTVTAASTMILETAIKSSHLLGLAFHVSVCMTVTTPRGK